MSQTKLQPWQIVDTNIIHATPWIEVIEDTCQVGTKTLTYTYSRRIDEGPLIIAETAEKKLWLVQQYRHPIKKIIWQFPCEGKFPNESWQAAAERGLCEELQLTAAQLQDLGQLYVDPGGLSQKYHAYLATNLSSLDDVGTQHTSENIAEVEELETQCFSREEIEQLITAGEICDNWTLAALFLYDRHKNRQGSL